MWICKEEIPTEKDKPPIINYATKQGGMDGLKWTAHIKKAMQFFTKVDAIAWIKYRNGYISCHFKFIQI